MRTFFSAVDGGNGVLILPDQPTICRFPRAICRCPCSGQFGLRGVKILLGLGEFVGQIIGAFGLRGGGILGLFVCGLRVGQLLFRLSQIGFASCPNPFSVSSVPWVWVKWVW